jgi:hypothetical protein
VSHLGFGREVREALQRRIDHLVSDGLARRDGQRVIFAQQLIETCGSATSTPRPRTLQSKAAFRTDRLNPASLSPVSTVSDSIWHLADLR